MKVEVLVGDRNRRRLVGTVSDVTLLAREEGALVLSGSGYVALGKLVADTRRDLLLGSDLSIMLDGVEYEGCDVTETPPKLLVRYSRKRHV